MLRAFIILLTAIAIAYLGLCAAVFVFQRSLIYFPQPRALVDKVLTISLPTTEAGVLVLMRPHDGPNALIYFGGNAEDTSLSLADFSTAFPNYAIYLLHYRGYGGSSGKPSEQALFEDGLALFDKVLVEHQRIVIIGRSLGTGVAVRVASLRAASRLVLVTPYDSLQDLAERMFPYIPVKWLLRDKYESWRYAPQVTAPTLILAAEHDEVIPRSSTELLHTRFRKGLASLKVVAGTSHNTLSENSQYLAMLKALP